MITMKSKSLLVVAVPTVLVLAAIVLFGVAVRHGPKARMKDTETIRADRAVLSLELHEHSDRFPSMDRLPRDPDLVSFLDTSAQERVPVDITTSLQRIRFEEDIPLVVSVLMDSEEDDTVRNEAANLLRRSGYKGITDTLIRVLNNPSEGPRFRAFCIQHLWRNADGVNIDEREKIAVTLRTALDDRHVPVRREALLALVRMGDPRGRRVAVEWLLDENSDNVRDAAIRCVRELGLREYAPMVRKYLHDENEVVRIAAIVTLAQWGDKQSRPAIEEAAQTDSPRLRRCAELALKRLEQAVTPKHEAEKKAEPEPAIEPMF